MGKNKLSGYPENRIGYGANERRKPGWFGWWIIPVLFSILAWLLFHYVLFIGFVPTESMEPTLKKGSCLLAERIGRDYGKGDIIIFRKEEKIYVKRIFAAGGDVVEMSGLKCISKKEAKKGKASEEGMVVVPRDCFFVLGDNRENSFDSRYWNERFVKREDVIGKVILYQGS